MANEPAATSCGSFGRREHKQYIRYIFHAANASRLGEYAYQKYRCLPCSFERCILHISYKTTKETAHADGSVARQGGSRLGTHRSLRLRLPTLLPGRRRLWRAVDPRLGLHLLGRPGFADRVAGRAVAWA